MPNEQVLERPAWAVKQWAVLTTAASGLIALTLAGWVVSNLGGTPLMFGRAAFMSGSLRVALAAGSVRLGREWYGPGVTTSTERTYRLPGLARLILFTEYEWCVPRRIAGGVRGWRGEVNLLGVALLMAGVLAFSAAHHRRRKSSARYGICDYPLRGLPEQRCPECGTQPSSPGGTNPDTRVATPASIPAGFRPSTWTSPGSPSESLDDRDSPRNPAGTSYFGHPAGDPAPG